MAFKEPTIEFFYDIDIRHYPYRDMPPITEIEWSNYILRLVAIAKDHPLVNGLLEREIDQFVLRVKRNNSQTIFDLRPFSTKYSNGVGMTPIIEVSANMLRVWQYGGVENKVCDRYNNYVGMPPIKLL